MDQINQVHIRGRVGSVRTRLVGEKSVSDFSIVTTMLYRGQDNVIVEENSWHNCVLWANKKEPDLSFLRSGLPLEITGRLRYRKFTTPDGIDRYTSDIVVNDVVHIDENEILKAVSTI